MRIKEALAAFEEVAAEAGHDVCYKPFLGGVAYAASTVVEAKDGKCRIIAYAILADILITTMDNEGAESKAKDAVKKILEGLRNVKKD